jgi:membrane protein required for colicin V production
MDGFTIVDGAVAGIIVLSALLAYARGLTREAMSIVGWIAAAVLAFTFAGAAEPLVREIPFLGDFVGGSCELSVIAAFLLVAVVSLVVISLFTPLLSGVVQSSALGPVDRGLGFLFGVLRGGLLVALAFLVYDWVIVNEGIAEVENSRSAQIYVRSREGLEAQVPADAPGWIVERYETLVGACAA